MLGNLFNSPTQLLVLVLVIVLLFGATRLPNAARQVGRSMRIFKSEMKEMKADGDDEPAARADSSREADRDAPGRNAPLEGRVLRDDHAPRTTEPRTTEPRATEPRATEPRTTEPRATTEPGTTSDGVRRDA